MGYLGLRRSAHFGVGLWGAVGGCMCVVIHGVDVKSSNDALKPRGMVYMHSEPSHQFIILVHIFSGLKEGQSWGTNPCLLLC